MFEPFFSTKPDGRGLGLSTVIGIVRGHGGVLRVHSELDCGSTFTVLLPVCADPRVDSAGTSPAGG
jgi:signal transduction histidine kinase